MNEPLDPNQTVADHSLPINSSKAEEEPGSRDSVRQPVRLRAAEDDSDHALKPDSDAMPSPAETGTRYQVAGEIARGGMGAVLRGRDVELGRDLAIKVLLDKYQHRPEVARRFLEEAQIGGQLQHPGVVPVYDIGRFGERPFFTMKLVKGRTLAALLEQRTDLEQDRPRLLGVALQVAQTLAYAHAKGVIHRDLKPANIMVGRFGEVQVMDWGLAKILAEEGSAEEARSQAHERQDLTAIRTARSGGPAGSSGTDTQAGSLLGTPAYMPPEQANGDLAQLGRRTDVFGLGAILCEILTGHPPYLGRSFEEVRRKAANGDQAEARTRLHACNADAEIISLTCACLAPEAVDRPKDAQAVAERLAAYFDGVQARLRQAEIAEAEARTRAEQEGERRVLADQLALEAQARASAERKRRRATAALAAAVVALAVLGGGGAFWLVEERQARFSQVTLALQEAELRRAQARTNPADSSLWASAREAVRRADALLGKGGPEPLRRQAQVLMDEIESEASAAGRDQKLLEGLAAVRAARMDRGLDATDAAYATVMREYRVDVDQSPTDVAARPFQERPAGFAIDVAAALDDWTAVRRERAQESAPWARPLDLARAIDPDPYRERIRSILKQTDLRSHVETLRDLARDPHAAELPPPSATLLARALFNAGDGSGAIRLLRSAVDRRPNDFWVNYDLATYFRTIEPAQLDEAIRYFTAARALRPATAHLLAHTLEERGRSAEALAVFEDLERRQPDEGAHSGCRGTLLKSLGRADEARSALERAVATHQRTLAASPDDAVAGHNLGISLGGLGRLDEAIEVFKGALRHRPDLAETHSALGVALSEARRPQEAEAAYREALRLRPDLMSARANLATQLQYQGRLEDAIAEFRALVNRAPHLASLHFNLGNALWNHKDLAEAAAEQREALRLDPNHIEARINLGCILCDKKEFAEGIALLREAVQRRPDHAKGWDNLARALLQKEDLEGLRELTRQQPKRAVAQAHLGKALFNRGQYQEALDPLRAAVALDPEYGWALTILGVCQSNLGRHEEAVQTLRRAVRQTPTDPMLHLNLGSALYAWELYDEAVAAFRESLRLRPDSASVQFNLGNALSQNGELDEAIGAYRAAIRLDPEDAEYRYRLGKALEDNRAFAEAATVYREVLRLRPNDLRSRDHLGNVLYQDGQVKDAFAVYHETLRLHPERADAHYGLGTIEMLEGELDKADASLREAVRLDPRHAEALCNLGQVLKSKGQFAEALVYFRRGHDAGTQRKDWKYPSADWVAECDKLVKLEKLLTEVAAGKSTPRDAAERLELVQASRLKRLFALSARLYAEAFAADPKLAEDLQAAHRYRAACCAARCAAGEGDDAARLDDKERGRLRRQALDWLSADLALWTKEWDSGQLAARLRVRQVLGYWRQDSELASIRDPAELAKLPLQDREALTKLWAGVAALTQEKP